MKILAVIPARYGSKGIPKKNIKNLAGKPLIWHTIKSAVEAKVFENVVVSTDSKKIKNVAEKAGADVPFLRDKFLSTDDALAIPVVENALLKSAKFYKKNFNAVCMLQPTTPLRVLEDYINVVKLFKSGRNVDSVISAVKATQSPYKMLKRDSEGYRIPFLDWPVENPPRQSLPTIYAYNGAFYLVKANVLLNQKTFIGKKCLLYEMPFERSVNIDTSFDFFIAENLIKYKKRR